MTKIVLIGAGSAVFGSGTIKDLLYYKDVLSGTEVCLVDTDPEKAKLMVKIANIMNDEEGSPFVIRGGTDRNKFLDGVDYVITSPAIEREAFWEKDWNIIKKHGIKETYGENGGPGCLSLTLRNIPMLLEIFRDVEKANPNALVINFTNPEARVCTLLSKYTNLEFVGLCHGIRSAYCTVEKVMGIPQEDLDIKAAGINHFTWIYDIRNKNHDKSIHDEFISKIKDMPSDFLPMARMLYETYGMFPTLDDNHMSEFLSYGYEYGGLEGRNFEANIKSKDDFLDWLYGVSEGKNKISEKFENRTDESVADIIACKVSGKNGYEVSVDIKNCGCIPNLPYDAIVEVPGMVSGDKVRGLIMDPLPEGIAAMLRTQISIHQLSVEAAVTGDYKKALQAMLLDPVCDNVESAKAALDELLSEFKDYVSPNFFK